VLHSLIILLQTDRFAIRSYIVVVTKIYQKTLIMTSSISSRSKKASTFSPSEIISFVDRHESSSKISGRGPETYLGAVLMKGDSWRWAEDKQSKKAAAHPSEFNALAA
jgi:hypothetical protein